MQGRIFLQDGHWFTVEDAEERVDLNTGIVKGFNISHAVELIRKNLIGPEVTDTFEP